MTDLRNVASCAIVVTLAACTAGGGPYLGSPTNALSPQRPARISTGMHNGPVLYLWNEPSESQEPAVSVYANGGAKLVRTITAPGNGTNGFNGMTSDAEGHLFMAYVPLNSSRNPPGYLSIYSRLGSRVVQKLKQSHQFQLPIIDSLGNLETMCAAGRVCTYAAADDQRVVKQQVIRRIALARISPYHKGVHDFAADKSGDLAINRGGVVQVFAPGATTPSWQEAPQTLDGMNSTAFDSKGNLYLAVRCVTDDAGEILEYQPNGKYPLRSIGQLNGIYCPDQVAVDGSDNLYVLQGGFPKTNVTVYPSSSNAPLRTITEGIVNGQSHLMALDVLGDLYITNGGVIGSDPGSVVVFQPGKTLPSRTITQGVLNPQGLSVGP